VAASAQTFLQAELTVAAIIPRDDRFLMVEERVQGRRVINQPAGHVEPGENLVDAVIRETLEETAWTFEPEGLVGIYLWQASDRKAPFLRVAFFGQGVSHDPLRALDIGIIRAVWLSSADLSARTQQLRSPMVLRGINDFLAGTRHPLDLVQNLGTEQLLQQAAQV
jgi:8-oxo-dGTP pyrophosphatase MutT (NUDIX family)